MIEILDEMKAMGHEYELLYLDASDDSLIRRYKETRRRHPLGQGKSLSENIAVERERLTEVRNRATHIIDTTDMPTAELKEKLEVVFRQWRCRAHDCFSTVLWF